MVEWNLGCKTKRTDRKWKSVSQARDIEAHNEPTYQLLSEEQAGAVLGDAAAIWIANQLDALLEWLDYAIHDVGEGHVLGKGGDKAMRSAG